MIPNAKYTDALIQTANRLLPIVLIIPPFPDRTVMKRRLSEAPQKDSRAQERGQPTPCKVYATQPFTVFIPWRGIRLASWWWFFPRVRGFRENVRQFISRLRFSF